MSQEDLKKKCYEVYKKDGQGGVFDYCNEIEHDKWCYCEPCEAKSPIADDGDCLVCGQDVGEEGKAKAAHGDPVQLCITVDLEDLDTLSDIPDEMDKSGIIEHILIQYQHKMQAKVQASDEETLTHEQVQDEYYKFLDSLDAPEEDYDCGESMNNWLDAHYDIVEDREDGTTIYKAKSSYLNNALNNTKNFYHIRDNYGVNAMEDSFHDKLHNTAQPDLFYTDPDNLPDDVLEKLKNADLEFFEEWGTGGGGVKLTLKDVEIDGFIYDLEYTADYCQDFHISYPDMDMEEVEEEMLNRAGEFLCDGMPSNVYVRLVDEVEAKVHASYKNKIVEYLLDGHEEENHFFENGDFDTVEEAVNSFKTTSHIYKQVLLLKYDGDEKKALNHVKKAAKSFGLD